MKITMRIQILFKVLVVSVIMIITKQQLYAQSAFLFGPDATVPKNDTVVIKLHDYVGDIQWQKTLELDGSDNWENISNATDDTLMFIADTTTYFRAKVVAGHCDPFYSDTTYVSVFSLKEKVVLVDNEDLELISSQGEQSNGMYRFVGDQGDLEQGSVIVGSEDEGFMRKVTELFLVGDTISLETEQATMEDVFDDFHLEDVIIITLDQNRSDIQGARIIPLEIQYMPPGAKLRSSGSGLDFSNTVIYSGGGIEVGIEQGSINFEPRIEREFDFDILTGLQSMSLVASGEIDSDFDFYIETTDQVSYSENILIGAFGVVVPVGPIPVAITLKFYLGFNANMEATIYVTAGYESEYDVEFGAEYDRDASPKWSSIWEREGDFTSHEPTYTVQGELTAKTYVKPELGVSIAGVAGTSLYVDPYVRLAAELEYPDPYWSWELAAGIGGYLNFKVGLFGYNLVDYTKALLNWEKIIADGWEYVDANLPILTTNAVTDITSNSAMSGGDITDDGGSFVTDRGVVWSTNQNPTLSNNEGYTTDGEGMGEFDSDLTGLSENTMYYVRAYATNSEGTAYGNQLDFFTNANLPTLTTTAITDITSNSGTSGGNITDDGGSTVTERGVVWSTSPNPTLSYNDGMTINGSGMGSFASLLTGLTPNTTYYVRAYATNSAGTAYGNELDFFTNADLPSLTTAAITDITSDSATSGGEITDDGGSFVTDRGVVWSTSPNPTLADNDGFTSDGTGTGSYVSSLTGLTPNTTYYVRAYGTNSAGTAYGNQLDFTTDNTSGCGGDVTFTYNGSSVTYGTVESADGRCWLDRNLGATQVATSSTDSDAYGDLFQWGRLDDGHQERTSATTTTLSNSDVPGHDMFIKVSGSPYDWRSPQNDNLWQGVSGTNNPCPAGYRLPTEAEWETERLSWSSNNAAGAFDSPLKLPLAGIRYGGSGTVNHEGSGGSYWSSTVDGIHASYLYFVSSSANEDSYYRAYGSSVRCIKE